MRNFVTFSAALALAVTLMSPSVSVAQEVDSNARADGFSDGLITAGRGSVVTSGGSTAVTRADTNPVYAAGASADSRTVAMFSGGRNGAAGDYLQESNAEADADIVSRPGQRESAAANAEGNGAYAANAVGAQRLTAGAAAGSADTRSVALDVPGGRGDISVAEAQQTSISGSTSAARDRTNAAAASSASASSRALATTD